jgi:uncharacterized protein YigA (DUF484 family)
MKNPMSPVTQVAPSGSAAADPAVGAPDRGVAAGAGSAAGGTLDDVQVAGWLKQHPDFFDSHEDLLASFRIRHPQGGKTISLVERQVLVLRERNKALEARMSDLIRIGQENDAIGARLQALTQDLLRTREPANLPAALLEGLQAGFGVPQVAIRLWGIQGVGAPFDDAVSPGLQRRAGDLRQPYCGPNSFPEAAAWLPQAGAETGSMALLALRGTRPAGESAARAVAGVGDVFGLLVLGSPDAARFQAGMGTAFLERIAAIASGSLSRLLG